MIIMALDHVRDFFHRQAMFFSPEDLAHTTPAIFFTRWITHFCAPVFMFTAGLGAFYFMQSGRSAGKVSDFLWKRGLWLVVLELTVLRFAMFLSLTSNPVFLTVLWALGWSMVVLSFLIHLPLRLLGVISIAVIVMHNLTDPLKAAQFGALGWLWKILHEGGAIKLGSVVVIVGYPLIPWFAVMAAGFCFGPVMKLEPARRRPIIFRTGLGMTISFVLLRGINLYGDPRPWTTALSFLRCNKYPPSLDYLLMTLGPALLVLALFEKCTFSKLNPLIVFGRTPLFFFLGHFLLAHLLAFPLAALRYSRVGFLWHTLPTLGGDAKLYPTDYGYSLSEVYLLWTLVVVLMYPLCLWYGRKKLERAPWWLRYL
jgi:uncharacterized membrane protein